MPFEVKVTGSRQMREVGRELRTMGLEGKVLRRELLASIRATAKPLLDDAKESALTTLPKAGGLNEYVAGSRMSVRNRLTGMKAGVRLRSSKSGHNLDAIDRGVVRHKVYGQWRAGVPDQAVPPGWWTKPITKGATKVQLGLFVVMGDVVNKIARR